MFLRCKALPTIKFIICLKLGEHGEWFDRFMICVFVNYIWPIRFLCHHTAETSGIFIYVINIQFLA
jgi:hypothetical protein